MWNNADITTDKQRFEVFNVQKAIYKPYPIKAIKRGDG